MDRLESKHLPKAPQQLLARKKLKHEWPEPKEDNLAQVVSAVGMPYVDSTVNIPGMGDISVLIPHEVAAAEDNLTVDHTCNATRQGLCEWLRLHCITILLVLMVVILVLILSVLLRPPPMGEVPTLSTAKTHTRSQNHIQVSDPKRVPARSCESSLDITFNLLPRSSWGRLRFPPPPKGCDQGGDFEDTVKMTGASDWGNVSAIVCEISPTVTSLTFTHLELDFKRVIKVCRLNEDCTGVIPNLEELHFQDLNMATSGCLFEFLESVNLPRLKRIMLHGLDFAGLNVNSFQRLAFNSATTLKVLEVRQMRSRDDPEVSILTNEICELLSTDFKMITDLQDESGEHQNFINSVKRHEKCELFVIPTKQSI